MLLGSVLDLKFGIGARKPKLAKSKFGTRILDSGAGVTAAMRMESVAGDMMDAIGTILNFGQPLTSAKYGVLTMPMLQS
jgi:hypothetical protein